MARRSEFADWVVEQLAPLGLVRAKGMFGGFGLYLDDLFFGLVADDVLYLKADEVNRSKFEKVGAEPFTYEAKGAKRVALSYYPPPEAALDDPDELADWARDSVDAALRARGRK